MDTFFCRYKRYVYGAAQGHASKVLRGAKAEMDRNAWEYLLCREIKTCGLLFNVRNPIMLERCLECNERIVFAARLVGSEHLRVGALVAGSPLYAMNGFACVNCYRRWQR